jgi:hypothetical protein
MSRRRGAVRCATSLCLVLLPGCAGTPDINGAIGITVAADGTPVAVVEVCHGSVDRITVAGPSRGTEPNEIRAEITSRDDVAAPMQVGLVAPGEQWRGTPLTVPLAGDLHIVIAGDRDANSQLTQADFTVAQLATLTPETVQYSDYDVEEGTVQVQAPLADFHAITCAADR